MTIFNQENVEDYYEIGDELGRWVLLGFFPFFLLTAELGVVLHGLTGIVDVE